MRKINPSGTVRVMVDGKVVDLPYSDYIISRKSDKSPLSRVFLLTTLKIAVPGDKEEED